MNLCALEEAIRVKVLEMPGVTRVHSIPVNGFKVEKGCVTGLLLGSGEEIACDRVIYADRWNGLLGMEGFPKTAPFIRKREPMGVLQATFVHHKPVGAGLLEGFYGPCHKDAGEDIQRNVWGYFSEDGKRSFWTLFLAADEAEDNHQIGKKLRRMKQTLDRMFTGDAWLAAGYTDFMSNVLDEQVRFEEGVVFASGQAPEKVMELSGLDGVTFLTDGYGPSLALAQVGVLLGEELQLNLVEAVDEFDAVVESSSEVVEGLVEAVDVAKVEMAPGAEA